MKVIVGGKSVSLDPKKSVGKGGEADVFDIGKGRALKLFRPAGHPDWAGNPAARQAADDRIAEHQKKLRAFPSGLPARVLAPEELVTEAGGTRIVGYTMRLLSGSEVLLRYGEKSFRRAGIGNEEVIEIFRDLHATVRGVHAAGVVIGDFNDLNVLVWGREAYLIDSDSFQFGPYLCRVFTDRFLDPLLCDPAAGQAMLARPYVPEADWYAFAVMLTRSLLYVDPYGGIFKPGNPGARVPPAARPLHRITIFHPEVQYPKPAERYDVLPDELLGYLHRVFVKDHREVFPVSLLERLRWTRCSACGCEHGRPVCPKCTQVSPSLPHVTVTVRGRVTATRIFETKGVILEAVSEGGGLKWLSFEHGELRREDGSVVIKGRLDPRARYRLSGRSTLIERNGEVVRWFPGRAEERFFVDRSPAGPSFSANLEHRYWTEGGRLLRDGALGPERIGDVLAGQTAFWVGPAFGFGFYRAGNIGVAFVFDARGAGINDGLKLPPFGGQLIHADCVFTAERCWFFCRVRAGAKTLSRCIVIRADGSIEAVLEAEEGDGTWLSSLRGRAAAAGRFLFVPTDAGIVRVEVEAGRIFEAASFPDTEPFVDQESRLFPADGRIAVVGSGDITLLRIDAD